MEEQDSLKFFATVTYVHPSFEELKRRFPGYVNPDYDGKRFDLVECCQGVSQRNHVVAFEYVRMDRDASIDQVLAEMDRNRLRPALYEELLSFAKKYPDEQCKHPIVALGSVSYVGCRRRVACLWGDVGDLRLDLCWFDTVWRDSYRFLAVRK